MNIDYNKPDFEISISVPRTAEIPVGVSKQYVDDADTQTLSTAQQYADELAERTIELADNSIKAEQTAREQADNEINKEINTLSQGLMDAESEINERITAEETARTTAGQAHEEQITAIQARFDDYTTHTEQASARQELEAQIEEKADKTIIATLATKTEVAEKADKSALNDLATKAEVNAKADVSALNALQEVVSEHTTAIATKAEKSALATLATEEEADKWEEWSEERKGEWEREHQKEELRG